jgi:hypothetical protein
MAQSLFGLTPEQIQQARQLQQQQAINEQAKSFGMFGPLYAASRGLSQTGINALAQGLFPEAQDPALRRATTTQAIVDKYKGQDINDPDILRRMALDFSNAGLTDVALQLGEESKKRVTAPVDPKKQAESIVLTIGQIPPGERTETQNSMFEAAQNLLAPVKDREPSKVGVSTDGKPVYRQGLEQFTLGPGGQKTPYYGQLREGGQSINISFDTPKEKFQAITEVNSQLKPLTTQINTLDQGIRTRLNSDSPFSQAVFSQVVASAFGDAQKAATEIEKLVNTGTLGQRLENSFNLFLTGKVGQLTRDDQMEVLLGLREYIGGQYDQTAAPYRSVAGDKADEIAPLANKRFALPKLSGNREYIPMSVVNQYNLKKGDTVKQGKKEFRYNGDGTITVLKGE